jgi:hypothetical protein
MCFEETQIKMAHFKQNVVIPSVLAFSTELNKKGMKTYFRTYTEVQA